MAVQAGSRLGPYEALSPIGAGGMREVYRARDTRLDRKVAVKVRAGPSGERYSGHPGCASPAASRRARCRRDGDTFNSRAAARTDSPSPVPDHGRSSSPSYSTHS